MGRSRCTLRPLPSRASAKADAQPLTLGRAAGGNIEPAGDEDYFSLTLTDTTYVSIGGVSEVTNISGGHDR